MQTTEHPLEILAFGDSLTWGRSPSEGRHAFADRWPTRLEDGLGNARVIAEGLRGRTTCYDRPSASSDMNGARVLPALLHSHAPLDAVVIMLGLNDIWEGFAEWQVRDGLLRLVEIVRHHPYRLPVPHHPKVLLVASPALVPCAGDPYVTEEKIALSRWLPGLMSAVAAETGVAWADMSEVAQASPLDGVHLDAASTRAIGDALVPAVQRLLQG